MKFERQRKVAPSLNLNARIKTSGGRRVLLAADGSKQHEHSKDQQDNAPDQIDVDVQRHGLRLFDETKCRQQHADERKHEADWPANVESHKKSVPFLG